MRYYRLSQFKISPFGWKDRPCGRRMAVTSAPWPWPLAHRPLLLHHSDLVVASRWWLLQQTNVLPTSRESCEMPSISFAISLFSCHYFVFSLINNTHLSIYQKKKNKKKTKIRNYWKSMRVWRLGNTEAVFMVTFKDWSDKTIFWWVNKLKCK